MFEVDFDKWLESPEGVQFINDFVKYIVDKDEYFCAKECWKWDCQYNSHFGSDEHVELGYYTVCHKFKHNEKNNCLERETWSE